MRLRRIGRWRKWGLGVVTAVLAFGIYIGALQLTGNFHTVIAGELYRSAQPTTLEIAEYKARYGIKTIINLRGRNEKKVWYRNELTVSRRLGIAHLDYRMSSGKILEQAEASRLIELIRAAEKPVLIHCKGGADRSGLAAALYLAAEGFGEEAAEGQLSLLYGHVAIPFVSKAFAMDDTFERLEPWLGFPDS